jgi:hypothetical protein
MLDHLFALLVLFQIKHLICDYPLQTPYMLKKFLPGWEFLMPLTAHAGVHALFTGGILIGYDLWLGPGFGFCLPATILVMLFDFAVHFIMDRIKAGPNYLGRYKMLSGSEFATASNTQKAHNKYFWWSLGLDQMVHHLTSFAIVYWMISYIWLK